MSKQTLVLDSSQITTYLECPTLWDYSYRQSIAKVGAAPNDAITMGTYGHRLLDIYYKAIAGGKSMSEGIEAALAFDPSIETCICGHARIEHKETHIHSEIYTACEYDNDNKTDCQCTKFKPKPFPLTKYQRKLVKERFTIHSYTYSYGDFTPTSPEHVEVGFSHKLYEDDDKLYILEGRIDVLGGYSGVSNAIMDHKFQMRRRDLYKKSIQFRNYSLVTGATLLIINYIRLTKEITKDTYNRVVANFSALEQEWWRGELIKVYDKIAAETASGTLEKRWNSCSGKFGYKCQYTGLCEEIIPEVVKVKKETLFQPKEVWRPW